MAYRGDDLDLRTPQSWTSAGREAGTGDQPNWWTRTTVYKGGRTDPIWVDDHVMACCNHAYDLAVAHRAPEVRLEHLINALTLNEHAAAVLEARGFSVASLRRESGTAIANDIPNAAGTSSGPPKRSEGVEETLRLAADHAYPRRTPVTVDDLLHVLFDMKRDLPGLQLLRRHAPAWGQRNGAEARPELRLDPLPHLSRPQPSQWSPRYVPQASQDYFAQPPARETAPPPREAPRQPAPTVDNFQNARLDSLERAVRDIAADLVEERNTLRSLVGDIQRTTATQADDTDRFRGGLTERLNTLEDTLLRSRNDAASLPGALLDRLSQIERMIDQRITDSIRNAVPGSVLIDRLAMIERTLEARLSEAALPPPPPAALLDRLTAIERRIEERVLDVARTASAIGERLASLESRTLQPGEATLPTLVSQRLENLPGISGKVDGLEREFQLILDRMTGIERHLDKIREPAPVVVDFTVLENKLQGLQATVEQSATEPLELAPLTDLLSGIEARIAGVERTLEHRAAETGRTVSFVGERLRAFEETIGGQKGETVDRLGQIERSLAAYAESTVSIGTTHEKDLEEVHEALLKLNANQQTLAGSLDQWRLDNTGDLSVINNRLKAIEELDQRTNPQIDGLSTQLTAIHAILSKREVRKSRFLHWLLGTDEWYSASYDTRHWRNRHAITPARTTTETVTIQQRPLPPPGTGPR
jgi:hypothetical protein